jgi:uncharacterized Zn-binding protein involved in type VI secretion
MTINYTTLLGLAKPVTGTEANTWGTVVNDEITSLLDTAVAGTTTLSSDADVTLTTTTGAANQARQAVILWTAGGTTLRTITAPAQSKTYIVINKTSSTQSIKLVGVGPTTGVTIIAGESAVCAWNGVDFIKTGSTIANAAGSNTQVQFNNSGVLGGSSNLTWNGSTLAVTGALTASANSTFSSTGALTISKGTTGERPTPASGMLRFNTTTTEFEGYNGTAWASVGGAALSNDTSTATDVFPLFANATTGTASTLFTGNASLLYKPSTGEFKARVPVASNGIMVNSLTVATSYTIASGFSGASAGPITIASGQSVTVAGGSRWVIS